MAPISLKEVTRIMTVCDNCGVTVTELEKVTTKQVDEESREVLGILGDFCSIRCSEAYAGENQ